MPGALSNKTILLSRAYEDSADSFDYLKSLDAEIIPFPTIKISAIEDFAEFDRHAGNLSTYDYLIFTSANGYRIFAQRMLELNILPDYSNFTVVAVGIKTAEVCEMMGVPVSIIPDEFHSIAVAERLRSEELTDKKVLIPCSILSKDDLKDLLTEQGAEVNQVPVYNVSEMPSEELEAEIAKIVNKKPDVFGFTSPSSFRKFISIMNITEPPRYFEGSTIAALGGTTKKSIEGYGVEVLIKPETSTLQGLAEEINKYYNKTGE